jgi:hypothetical protein
LTKLSPIDNRLKGGSWASGCDLRDERWKCLTADFLLLRGPASFLYYAIRQSQGKLMISSGKKASDPKSR